MKEGALDRTMWRNRFGRGFGPVVWQITDDDDIYIRMRMELVLNKKKKGMCLRFKKKIVLILLDHTVSST